MKPFTASRLYIYYGERVIEGTVPYDAGAQIRDGVKIVAVKGVCEEILWPYIESKFDERPSQAALDRGAKKAGTRYERVLQTLPEIKAAIASGFCPIFGFSVFESFESDDVAKTGVVPIPDPEEELIGGHAVMMCGYDDSIECFEVENSWGPNWGDHGFFWLPYEFADRHMSSDYWILKTII
jgi:C1A family cysteine protease